MLSVPLWYGKTVIAPQHQLQEVRNTIRTYEVSYAWDAYCVADMLQSHACMMLGLCAEPGQFRKGGVGVFAGDKLIHMAPPAHLVPTLTYQLFHWLHQAEDHLLIRSCVFHYEFEFIHPFSDGNGRIYGVRQSNGLLPAIEESTAQSNCSPFIDFMLGEMLQALQRISSALSLPLNLYEPFYYRLPPQRPPSCA